MKVIKISLVSITIILLLLANVTSIEDASKTGVSVSNTTKGLINISKANVSDELYSLEEVSRSTKAIFVKYTQAEINELENREITNPKIPYSLGFISESFAPFQKLDNRIENKLREFNTPNYIGKNYTYAFVMITGRITSEKLQSITNYGVKLLGYHSGHSYKAKIPLDKINEIKDLPFVKWVGYSTLRQKLHPNLFDKINVIDDDIFINESVVNKQMPVYINLFDNDVNNEFKNMLEQKGVNIFEYNKNLLSYRASLTPGILKDIINLDFILFVEGEAKTVPLHDESMPSISADYLRSSYDGSGISMGIIDSGFEADHQDLPSITACNDYSSDNDCEEDNCGHGSHVSGTIFGRGNANSKYKSVAPGITDVTMAKIVQNDCGIFTSDFENAINWIGDVASPPDIVSISIGTNYVSCRGTDQGSRNADSNVYDDEQILVVAAGNCGPGGNNNQCNPITPGASETITSPGCAKNAITVGSVLDYGNDTIDQISSSSSRGPTADGRRKPDIVAPGCSINSTDYQDNDGYTVKCGTSMATPHVSGLIATALEHYPEWKKNASTVKAVLLATALVHEGNISNVDYAYSHGKVDSYLTHYVMDDPYGWKWGTIWGEVSDGNWQYYNITVPSDADRLVVVLTWTEPAASAGANSAVINDIDLFIDKDGNEAGCESGEWNSISSDDNVEYKYIDNPGSGTFKLKFCPWFINDTVSPQQYRAAYMIIRGDPTPLTILTATANDTSVYLGEQFTVTATVEPSMYVASGVYARLLNIPSGVDVLKMETTREDGTVMIYPSTIFMNLGDIHEEDTRSVTWTLNATSTGTKVMNTYINSDNGGTDTDSVTVTVSLFPDGHSCTQDSQCQSNYCDNDGVGLADDNWCFTPYNTYFDGQEQTYCEYATDNATADCDERQVGEDLNKCVGTSYYEEECSSTCNYQDVTSVFECTESGCSCAESLCDGGTTGTAITTCAANKTYFADKCASTASGEDRSDNICKSSAFASGCTASSQCNDVTAGTSIGTGSCSQACLYDAFPNVTLVSPQDGNISSTGNVVFNCSAIDDYNLTNMTLYHNITGFWLANETKSLTGTADSKNFTINDIPDGINFIWNCLAYDNASQIGWADTNYTVIMNIPEVNITISSLSAVSSFGTYKVFEAIIMNNGEISLQNVTWTLNLGDGALINSTRNAGLAVNESMILYAEYNYSSQGNYVVIANATALSQGVSAMQILEVSAGALSVSNFSVINSSGTLRTFEAYLKNYMAVNMTNVSWSLNTGNGIVSSALPVALQPQEVVLVFVQYNYTSAGVFAANFTAVNGSWNDLEALNVTIT